MRYSTEVSILLTTVTLVAANLHKNENNSLVTYWPRTGWINDPNGLVRLGKIYHLFYQHNPNSDIAANISWGHATSNDLVNWRDKGVALPYNATTLEQRFSGSAVYDRHNVSGFGLSSGPLVAAYTSYYAENSTFPDGSPVEKGTQSQNLVYSRDGGETWYAYRGNPILKYPPRQYADQYKQFRDPKMFWYAPHSKWVMVVALSMLHKVLLYSSTNLKAWTYMSEFGVKNPPPHSMWECPDLYRLKVLRHNESKWILSVSLLPEAKKAGYTDGMFYIVGHFDGTTFATDENQMEPMKRLDYGSDFYAGVTWNNVGGRRLMIGWVDNWEYAGNITSKYRGGLSLVRQLSLSKRGDEYKLVQKPIENLRNYVKEAHNYTKADAENGIEMRENNAYSFVVNASRVTGTSFSFIIQDQRGRREAEIRFNHENKSISVEKLNMDPSDDRKRVQHWAKFEPGSEIPLNVFVDRRTLTVFCNDGEVVFTELLISRSKIRKLKLRKGSAAEVSVTQLLLAIGHDDILGLYGLKNLAQENKETPRNTKGGKIYESESLIYEHEYPST